MTIILEKLQEVLGGLAFCSLEQEFGREMLEGTRGLAKIFRLSQLVIQYLMYCQVGPGSRLPSLSSYPLTLGPALSPH